nr:uncharacterized protein LOC109193148 isoform X1 [Ipomoea batatas]
MAERGGLQPGKRAGGSSLASEPSKKPKGASSIGCSSQLRNDDDDFVEGSSPFLGRMQRDPLWDAPDTDLNAEERGRFLTFKVRVPPSLFVEALEDMCAKFLPYV